MLKTNTIARGLLALTLLTSAAHADVITGAAETNHNHNTGSLESPFFTRTFDSNGTDVYDFGASNGLAGSIEVGTAIATNVSGTITVVGNATSAGGWTDGNGIPDGITLTYDLAFDLTGTPAGGNPAGVLSSANNNTGNGIGINSNGSTTFGALDANGEVLTFSAATISNVSFSGTVLEANFEFTPGTVDGVSLVGFRSNSFNEASNGATLSNGTDTIGFGTSSGTLASNVVMNNNNGTRFPALAMDTALSLNADEGNFHLKGFTLQSSFTYNISAVPEPGSVAMLSALGLAGLFRRRRA